MTISLVGLGRVLALVSCSCSMASASAQALDNWRNGAGDLCWRSGAWTPATAAQGCDGVIVAAAPIKPVAPLAPPRPVTLVVLLPDAGGKVGNIELSSGAHRVQMNRAFEQVSADADSQRSELLSKAEVDRRYGALVRSLPRAASSFLLYFETGGERLTAQSQALVEEIRKRLSDYPGVDVVVFGHTDRQGSDAANDSLSLRRAHAVRTMLVAAGFPVERMDAVGRGERELIVPTADGVAEPRNRRVEVKLR